MTDPLDAVKLYKSLPDLIPQKVNLNGSSQQSLRDQYLFCLEAIDKLSIAMAQAMPHGRDYQTHTDVDAAIKARRAWGMRRVLINEMRNDIEHSAEMVSDQ